MTTGFALQEFNGGYRILIHIMEPGITELEALERALRELQIEVLRRSNRRRN